MTTATKRAPKIQTANTGGNDEAEKTQEKENVLNAAETRETVGQYRDRVAKEKAEAKPFAPVADAPSKPKEVPILSKGLIHFEAPDGTLVAGEKGQTRLWYRKMNGGKGGWIRPKR